MEFKILNHQQNFNLKSNNLGGFTKSSDTGRSFHHSNNFKANGNIDKARSCYTFKSDYNNNPYMTENEESNRYSNLPLNEEKIKFESNSRANCCSNIDNKCNIF